jgi:Oxidoreductase molybdopterin binding domain
MNGQTLPTLHGFPLRLIAPAWYGVVNVKWLTRIEVVDHRHAVVSWLRDYVSIREQERDGQTVWTFNTVGHARLKSAPAKVTRRRGRYIVMGAAWGAPIARVEMQIDHGPWMATRLDAPPLLAETEVQTDDESLREGTGHGPERHGKVAATHGDSGTSIGGRPHLANTRSGRGHLTFTATCSQRPTTRFSLAR